MKGVTPMLTWVLGYLLIGFFIYWLAAAVFGADPDVPPMWQLLGVIVWPLVVLMSVYRTQTGQPIDQFAFEAALHRHDRPPSRSRVHGQHRRRARHPILKKAS
jgi:hypothetical protein